MWWQILHEVLPLQPPGVMTFRNTLILTSSPSIMVGHGENLMQSAVTRWSVTHTRTHTHTHTHVHITHTHTHVYTRTHMYTHTHTHTHTHVHTTHMHTHVHTRTHMYTHTHTGTGTCTHTYVRTRTSTVLVHIKLCHRSAWEAISLLSTSSPT